MRVWIPWTLLVVLIAMTAAAATLGATTAPGEPTHLELISPFYSPSPLLLKTNLNTACERTAQNQIQMDECAQSQLHQLGSQLSTLLAYQRRASGSNVVNAAESAFRSYMKAECAAASAQNDGGTVYPLIYSECEIDLTLQRIEEVRRDLLGVGH